MIKFSIKESFPMARSLITGDDVTEIETICISVFCFSRLVTNAVNPLMGSAELELVSPPNVAFHLF